MRFYVIAFILIIVSCTNNNDLQSEVESITGRIVPFECKDLHCCNYDNQLVIWKLLSSPKILSYIDEFPCKTCRTDYVQETIRNTFANEKMEALFKKVIAKEREKNK